MHRRRTDPNPLVRLWRWFNTDLLAEYNRIQALLNVR